jgi:uncharacterized SAM-binding protein YcdF (DUF218 family)
MFYVLSKLLTFLLSPFNLAIFSALAALVFARYRKRLLILAFALLVVFSNPLLFRLTIGWWEKAPLPLPVNHPGCRNIVVLGGLSSQHEGSGRVRFSQSSDRLMQALLLSKQNPFEHLIISGGNASILFDRRPEGAYLKETLTTLGWPENQVLVDSLSRNTFENALNTRQLFVERGFPLEIALVTSAWHMPRARRCFEKQGFKVLPVEADYMRPMGRLSPAEIWIPSADTLSSWNGLFKEWIGLVYYFARGYI